MTLVFAVAQCNSIVGYIDANLARIAALYDIAALAGADLVIFPEMALTGYPVEDMALNTSFQTLSMEAVETLAARTSNTNAALLIGGLWREDGQVYNAAFLLDGGKIIHRHYKHHLPDYGVFDETRIFRAGPLPEPFLWRGISLGLMICEDMWFPGVSAHLKRKGADLLISVNASPYEAGKAQTRERVALARARETGLPLIYVNQAGAQDELVFDGTSFALSPQGAVCHRSPGFREDLAFIRLNRQESGWQPEPGSIAPTVCEEETIYGAMMLGLRDFIQKNGFSGVVLGLSGGMDSALSAAVAVDALGADRVRAVLLPSPITSRESIEDAMQCAELLRIRLDTISIEAGMRGFAAMLSASFGGELPGFTTESNQPRLRAGILMAISQRENRLLLNTGNKSEMAVGYTTLYGDMCGHYGVLKDLYKTRVYDLANWRNGQGRVIPARIFTKPPSAELKPGQTDQDILPPYPVLDAILSRLVEGNLCAEDVIAEGFERRVVEQVSHMLFAAEYKRRQACPGVRLTGGSFSRDRRYPLSNGWRGLRLAPQN